MLKWKTGTLSTQPARTGSTTGCPPNHSHWRMAHSHLPLRSSSHMQQCFRIGMISVLRCPCRMLRNTVKLCIIFNTIHLSRCTSDKVAFIVPSCSRHQQIRNSRYLCLSGHKCSVNYLPFRIHSSFLLHHPPRITAISIQPRSFWKTRAEEYLTPSMVTI